MSILSRIFYSGIFIFIIPVLLERKDVCRLATPFCISNEVSCVNVARPLIANSIVLDQI